MSVKVTRNSNTPVDISDIAPDVPGARLAYIWAKRTGVPEVIWPRFGPLFGIDDDQMLFNIPYLEPASASEVGDLGDTVQVINAALQHDGIIYGARSDLLSNPLYTDEWFMIGQNGDIRKIGNFPDNWHTRGVAYDVDRNRVYFLRGGNTNARLMRYEGLTQANITGRVRGDHGQRAHHHARYPGHLGHAQRATGRLRPAHSGTTTSMSAGPSTSFYVST